MTLLDPLHSHNSSITALQGGILVRSGLGKDRQWRGRRGNARKYTRYLWKCVGVWEKRGSLWWGIRRGGDRSLCKFKANQKRCDVYGRFSYTAFGCIMSGEGAAPLSVEHTTPGCAPCVETLSTLNLSRLSEDVQSTSFIETKVLNICCQCNAFRLMLDSERSGDIYKISSF